MEIIKELIERWNSKSPEIFKKITRISITIGTMAFGLWSANEMFDLQGMGVPEIIFKIDGYILAVCGAMGITSKITKE